MLNKLGSFQYISQVHSRELRNTKTDLRVPQRIGRNDQKSFAYRGAKLWNQLSNDQKSTSSRKAFRKAHLGRYLGHVSFYNSVYSQIRVSRIDSDQAK